MGTWQRALLSLFLLAAGLSADDYPRQPGIDVQRYLFRIALSDQTNEIEGEATVDLRFVEGGLKEFSLDLASPLNGTGMRVTAVGAGGEPVWYTQAANRLRIAPAVPAMAGERRQFTVRYRGVPAAGLKAGKNRFGERVFFSSNWRDLARQWLPTVDHPSDKAAVEFLVTAPAGYQVVANGVLLEETDLPGGRRTTHWKQQAPIATWLANIGVAPFSTRHYGSAAGVPLQTWTFSPDRANGIVTFESATRDAMEFFSRRIGPYPYEKLANVQAAGFEGAMEHASAIFYAEKVVTGQPVPAVVAHEIAHQWFGNSVTQADWDHVWLSEGFATYLTLLFTEHMNGRDAFLAELMRSRAAIFERERKMPDVAVIQQRPWNGIPNGIVYQKGAWALHMLRTLVGDDKFWEGMREYYRIFRDRNVVTADFERVMEEVSGADLGWFFRQWLCRAGTPSIDGSWRYDARRKTIVLELAQTQRGETYRLPLEVGIASGIKEHIARIEMTEKRQRFEIAAEAPPSTLMLDPNARLLFRGRFAKR